MKILKTRKRLYSLSFILVFTFALVFFVNLFGCYYLEIEKYSGLFHMNIERKELFFYKFPLFLGVIVGGGFEVYFDGYLNLFSFLVIGFLVLFAFIFERLFPIFFALYLLLKLRKIKQEKRRISIDLKIIKKSFILLYLVFFFLLCVLDILVFLLSFRDCGYYDSLGVINITLLYILPILPVLFVKLTLLKKQKS